MSLLVDQNLSHRLVPLLVNDYPGVQHVRNVGLAFADDQAIWEFARQHAVTIVTKDSDFQHRALLYGPPPKTIWLRVGNDSTTKVAALVASQKIAVAAFESDPIASLLVLP